MKTQTLKKLITQACDDACKNNYLSSKVVDEMRDRIFMLIDLYEQDKTFEVNDFNPPTILAGQTDEVPYSSICSCNPANGGGGICGCVMANKMVPNPKKYLYPGSLTTASTDQINITSTNSYTTNIKASNETTNV